MAREVRTLSEPAPYSRPRAGQKYPPLLQRFSRLAESSHTSNDRATAVVAAGLLLAMYPRGNLPVDSALLS